MLKPIHFLLAAAVLGLGACAGPGVRFATAAETAQATARQAQARAQASPTPTPTASPSPATGVVPLPSPSAGSGALSQFQAELEAVAKSILPSIVQIDTSGGLGSGIIYDAAGDIVTNDHVVQGATSYTVKTSDGKTYTASLAGRYPANDLAVIKIANATGLTPAKFADSSQVQVGEVVLAIGSPFGLTDTVTEGIVSAVGRTQSEGGNSVTLTDLIQTSALINPGNSGGALVDLNGQVIGIPTLSGSDAQGRQASAGIGFAIPSNQVTDAAKQIVAGGSVTHSNRPYLAITTRDNATSGVDVVTVVAGGPAAQAGIQAGWVITGIGGHDVADSSALSQALAGYKPGNRVSVALRLPDGTSRTVTVTLGERPVTP
jgi:S1-C subfamily serine protease